MNSPRELLISHAKCDLGFLLRLSGYSPMLTHEMIMIMIMIMIMMDKIILYYDNDDEVCMRMSVNRFDIFSRHALGSHLAIAIHWWPRVDRLLSRCFPKCLREIRCSSNY